MDVFKDEFVPNIEGQSQHDKWVRANPGENAKWKTWRDACIAYDGSGSAPAPPTLATKYGKALVAAGKLDVSVTDIGADYTTPPDHPPDPPPPTTAYFVEDWSTGRFETRWDDLYSYSNPGFFPTPRQSTPDGRVKVVANPSGSGGFAARCEINQNDPVNYSVANVDKSEINLGNSSRTWNGAWVPGTIRWFDWYMYFPWTTTEKFELPRGGSSFFALFGLHPPGGSPAFWSTNHLEWNPYQWNQSGAVFYQYRNVYLNFHSEGGLWSQSSSNPNDRNWSIGLQLTDANANPVLSSYNKWVRLVWGAKFNSDNTGWLELWFDDGNGLVNSIPRVNRPTAWDVDTQYPQSYFKYGLYTGTTSTFPVSQATVMYWGRTTIGTDRPF